jgi:hypothetical protein
MWALEPLHLAVRATALLMRIFSSIVFPSPALVPPFDPKIPDRWRRLKSGFPAVAFSVGSASSRRRSIEVLEADQLSFALTKRKPSWSIDFIISHTILSIFAPPSTVWTKFGCNFIKTGRMAVRAAIACMGSLSSKMTPTNQHAIMNAAGIEGSEITQARKR